MKHRILYINSVGRVGGAERSLLQLIGELDRSRFEASGAVPAPSPLAKQLREKDCQVFPIPTFRPRRTFDPVSVSRFAAVWMRASWQVAQVACDLDVSLIHSNSTNSHIVGAVAALMSRKTALWHVRDMEMPFLLKHLFQLSTSGIVYCSNAVKDELSKQVPHNVRNWVVHNAIDAESFEDEARPGSFRDEFDIAAETKIVLMAAQMVPWKRHEDAIRAVAGIPAESVNWKLVIAGGDLFGEHCAYETRLRNVVSELALEDNVIFTGYRRDMATLMADCDVVVAPSQKEPFGRVALEAMAMAKPVVATDDAGLAEVVADGETGLLVSCGAVDELEEALREILELEETAERMGRAGYARVKNEFDLEDHARQLEEIYDALIDTRRSDNA